MEGETAIGKDRGGDGEREEEVRVREKRQGRNGKWRGCELRGRWRDGER